MARDEGRLATSSLAVGRLRPKKARRSPRGRLVASLLPGIPIKNSNNRKIVSARGTIGRGKKRELFLPPILPRALTFFLLPSLPTTQRDLCGGERVWEPAGRNSTLNPFAPGDFAEKRVLKLVEWFSGHCRAIKS